MFSGQPLLSSRSRRVVTQSGLAECRREKRQATTVQFSSDVTITVDTSPEAVTSITHTFDPSCRRTQSQQGRRTLSRVGSCRKLALSIFSWPFVFEPQPYTSPVLISASVWSSPAVILITGPCGMRARFGTRLGRVEEGRATYVGTVLPRPSWPMSFAPHAHTSQNVLATCGDTNEWKFPSGWSSSRTCSSVSALPTELSSVRLSQRSSETHPRTTR